MQILREPSGIPGRKWCVSVRLGHHQFGRILIMPRKLISAVVSCYEWCDFHVVLARPREALLYLARGVLVSRSRFGCMSLMPSGNCITRSNNRLSEHEPSRGPVKFLAWCIGVTIWLWLYKSLAIPYLKHETTTVLRQCMRSCQRCNELVQYSQS